MNWAGDPSGSQTTDKSRLQVRRGRHRHINKGEHTPTDIEALWAVTISKECVSESLLPAARRLEAQRGAHRLTSPSQGANTKKFDLGDLVLVGRCMAEKSDVFLRPLATLGDPWARVGSSFGGNLSTYRPTGSPAAPMRPAYSCPLAPEFPQTHAGLSTAVLSRRWTDPSYPKIEPRSPALR